MKCWWLYSVLGREMEPLALLYSHPTRVRLSLLSFPKGLSISSELLLEALSQEGLRVNSLEAAK